MLNIIYAKYNLNIIILPRAPPSSSLVTGLPGTVLKPSCRAPRFIENNCKNPSASPTTICQVIKGLHIYVSLNTKDKLFVNVF